MIGSLKSFIVTGNTRYVVDVNCPIYADGGANLYTNEKIEGAIWGIDKETTKENIKHLSLECIITEEEQNTINSILRDIDLLDKVTNRGNVCMSIKPIDNQHRKTLVYLLSEVLGDNYVVNKTGNTTVDIFKKSNNKLIAIRDIKANNPGKIFYLGDEYKNGNDKIVLDNSEKYGINFIKVNNPVMTSIFIRSIYRLGEVN